MLAYFKQTDYEKGELKNYMTVKIDQSYMKWFELFPKGKVQMQMYFYESLLPQSRQYQALINLRISPLCPLIIDPPKYEPKCDTPHKSAEIIHQ